MRTKISFTTGPSDPTLPSVDGCRRNRPSSVTEKVRGPYCQEHPCEYRYGCQTGRRDFMGRECSPSEVGEFWGLRLSSTVGDVGPFPEVPGEEGLVLDCGESALDLPGNSL